MATITLTPASGSITAKKTVVRVNVAGAATNDTATYNATHVPTEDPFGYYLLFDAAGTWTVRFRNAATDGDVATASVTVA